MDVRYESYCLADPRYYDTPARARIADDQRDYDQVVQAPDGWLRVLADQWMQYVPPIDHLPQQGWKIHVSTTLADASSTLAIVSTYCIRRGISFKFLPTRIVDGLNLHTVALLARHFP